MLAVHYAMYFVVAYFCPGKTEKFVITVLAMIGKSGVAGAWSAVQVFSAEVFPTVIRWLLHKLIITCQ